MGGGEIEINGQVGINRKVCVESGIRLGSLKKKFNLNSRPGSSIPNAEILYRFISLFLLHADNHAFIFGTTSVL